MDMTDPTIQMLAYELAAIFAAIAGWLVFKAYKKNKQVKSDAAAVVKRIKRQKDRRVEQLSELLAEKYHFSGEALQQTAEAIQQREQNLYKAQMSLFVEQDAKTLKQMPTQIEQAVDACLELLPMGGAEPVAQQEQTAAVDDTLTETIAATALKVDELVETVKNLNVAEPATADTVLNEVEAISEPEPEPETDEVPETEQSEIESEPAPEPEAGTEAELEEIEEALTEEAVDEQQEPGEEVLVSEDDIDALLDDLEDDVASIDLAATDEDSSAVVQDEQDIDDILNQVADVSDEPEQEAAVDDIDALLNSASQDQLVEEDEGVTAELSADDIEALLDDALSDDESAVDDIDALVEKEQAT